MSDNLAIAKAPPPAPATPPAERSRLAPVAPPGPTPPVSTTPNPTLRLDPGLGIVVIQFHDQTGGTESSYPSQRQLQSYRQAQEAGPSRPAAPDNADTRETPPTIA